MIRHVSLILLMFAVSSPGDALAQTQNDAQMWLGLTGEVDITRALRLDITQELRLDNTFTSYARALTEAQLRLRVAPFLRLSGHFRYIRLADEVRHRVGGDVEARYRANPWTLSYRLRFQRVTRANDVRSFVRNRVKGSYRASKKLTPFVALEVFYSTTRTEFRQIRPYIGASYRLGKRLDLEAAYLYRYEFNVPLPERDHVLSLSLSYQFRDVRRGKKKQQKKEGEEEEVTPRIRTRTGTAATTRMRTTPR